MQRGFGGRRGIPMVAVGVATMIAVLVGVPVFLHELGMRDSRAAARVWLPPGAPCPEVSATTFATYPMSRPRTVKYGSMTLTRGAGILECTDLRYDEGWQNGEYPVCRMGSPNLLKVEVDGKDHYFFPGYGRGVTVSLPHGRLVCQIGPNHPVDNDPRTPFG